MLTDLSATLFRVGCALLLAFIAGCSSTPDTPYTLYQNEHQPTVIIWENSNSHSNNEATLQLVVQAGSLQERDDQLGYAHFVEHMIFRGTENYPRAEMRERLRELNVDIGHHSNAYVTFDHTAYWLDLNSIEPERLETGIEMLSEWAYRVSFDPDDVESERAVVLEEWRLTEPEAERASQQVFADFYAGSRHQERHPIGTEDSIRKATPEGLREFYDTWYRPDNMAVIVTGDVDRDQVKALVDQHFPPQPVAADAPVPQQWDINPGAMDPRPAFTDPYITDGFADMRFFQEAPMPTTAQEVVDRVQEELALDVLIDRLDRRVTETRGSVAWFNWYREFSSPNVRVLDLEVSLTEDDFELGLGLLEEERQRLLAEGIRQRELDDWRRRRLEQERSEQDSAGHLAGIALDHYLYGWPMLSQAQWVALLEEAAPTWTTESVTAALAEAMSVEPQVRIIHPYRMTPPATETIDGWLASAAWVPDETDRLGNGAEQVADWTLDPAYAGSIVRERDLEHEVTEWTLSNGMTVWYRHAAANPGEVSFQLVGLGGFNRLPEAEVVTGRLTVEAMTASGLRNLDGPELRQWLQRESITLDLGMDFFDRFAYGNAPAERLGLALNLLHIGLTEGRVDPDTAEHQRAQGLSYLQQLDNHPHRPWMDLLHEQLHRQEPAQRMLTPAEVEGASTEAMRAFYDRHIAGAQNYTLAIAGDVDRDTVRQHVLAAVATLPPTEAPLGATRQLPVPTESGQWHVAGSGERHASILLRYAIPKAEHADLDRTAMLYMEHWLDEVLMDEIRTASGLAYSVQGDTEGYSRYHDDYVLWVHLGTDPERVEEAIERVEATLARAATVDLAQERVDRWQQRMENDRRRQRGSADWTVGRLAYAQLFERAPTVGLDGRYANVEAAVLPELLSLFLNDSAVRSEFVWLP
ncbi:insulinase family protein [Natronospirillum operosum]|uniref:Insulinase family protein n=1 Tax=Natronospirillum operosum TaxID=2759953 RepID=A0A4Z0WAZ1_9GAMM|nr:M16 family metallopeptidase [Natronospirillum operosum]TGG90667.1 insulinase family protein [Natronospirillum operosum]